MILRILAAVLALAFAPACKKEPPIAVEEPLASLRSFQEVMCSCKDSDCALKVQEQVTRWSRDLAQKAGDRKPEPMSEEMTKTYTKVVTTYSECLKKAMGAEPEPPKADPPPPPLEKITNADRLIKHRFDTVGANDAVATLILSYVRADGTIDDTFGEAIFNLGIPEPPDPADDPDRPIGAPAIDASPRSVSPDARCPMTRWKRGTPTVTMGTCKMTDRGLTRPKCSVVEIWKRAIDKGAPAKALAVLELHAGQPQKWTFRIDDEPRNIHFTIDVEDTCDPTLERPQ